MANRALILSPSAVVHSASAARHFGLVGAGSASLLDVGDCEALIPEEPGSSLVYVHPAESTHAAAMTATSRFTSRATILGSAALSARRSYRDAMKPAERTIRAVDSS
jgi:hypothetical protein